MFYHIPLIHFPNIQMQGRRFEWTTSKNEKLSDCTFFFCLYLTFFDMDNIVEKGRLYDQPYVTHDIRNINPVKIILTRQKLFISLAGKHYHDVDRTLLFPK